MLRLYLGLASKQRELFQKENSKYPLKNLHLNTYWSKSLISVSWKNTLEITFVNLETIFATFDMQYNK